MAADRAPEPQPVGIPHLHAAAQENARRKRGGEGSKEKGGLMMYHYKLRKVACYLPFLPEDKTMMMIIITSDFFITSLDLTGILVNHLEFSTLSL